MKPQTLDLQIFQLLSAITNSACNDKSAYFYESIMHTEGTVLL